MNKKPRVVFKKKINPLRFINCFKCKMHIWPLQKRVIIGVKFPSKVLSYTICMECYRKKYLHD